MLSAIALAIAAPTVAVIDGAPVNPGRLLVKAPLSSARTASAMVGGRVTRHLPEIGWSIVLVPPTKTKSARSTMLSQPGVTRVEFDRAAKLAYTPNDPLWPSQWHLRNIKADLAWDTSHGTNQVTVAVIDTGVLRTHQDLASNMWENTGEIAGNNIDDDNNGYIDDRYGWDFANNDNSPEDNYGHGTPCAGIVAALQDNNIGVSGIAHRAKVMNLKATNDSGFLFDSYLIPAYVYGANMGAKVFSMSYFSDRVSQAEKDAMDYAVSRGVLPIAASGNSDQSVPYYPGSYDNVIGVGAVDGNNVKSWFSDFGHWVDVAAPGEGLTTTGNDGGYTGFGGTSGATPHVAGAAALLMGTLPTATAQQVREALEDTAVPLNQAGYGEWVNYGFIDTQAALLALIAGGAPDKSVKVRCASLLGISPGASTIDPAAFKTTRLYGRGFTGVANLRVTQNGANRTIRSKTRDTLDVDISRRIAGPIVVWDGNTQLATLQNPSVTRWCHPMTDGSAPGAAFGGGFYDTLLVDGQTMAAGRHGDGFVRMLGLFKNVTLRNRMQLSLTRRYTAAGTSETVYLYDWSSGSYPYGAWTALGTGSTPTGMTTSTYDIANISPFIDPEGSVYVMVLTSSDMPIGAELRLDMLRLQDRP